MEDQMTLKQLIQDYVHQLPKRLREQGKNRILKMLINYFTQIEYLNSNIQAILKDFNKFLQDSSNYIQTYTRDKNKVNKVIKEFITFICSKYDIKIDIDTYFPTLNFKEKPIRMIELLKYLQEKPKTRPEIAAHFDISETQLSDDLGELQDGSYSFLGYKMKIDLNRGDNTYNSTIHPVFLPLNLSEVYALTIGLKQAGKGTVYKDIFNYISDSIYDQLSAYGKRRILDKAKELDLYFNDTVQKTYRYEPDEPDKYLKQKRSQMLAYYLKSGALCKVEYDADEGIKTAIGRVDYAKDPQEGYSINRITVANDEKEEIEINVKKVMTIRFVDSAD